MNLTNSEIALQVEQRLNDSRLTLEECCNDFNIKYSDEIEAGITKPLNKDFLSRVKREAFRVYSPRISKLCEFLEIEEALGIGEPLQDLSREIEEFRNYSNKHTGFRNRFPTVGKFLSGLNLKQMFDES